MTLELKGIEHSFGTNQVLKGIDFTLQPGEVHALLGANGAGKSTLLQIIAGVYVPTKGELALEGKQVVFTSPSEALGLGITFLTQEVDRGLIPDLTIHENFMISLWGKEKQFLFNRKANRRRVADVFSRYGIDINVDKYIRECSIAEKQMVSIIRAISNDSKYILLDEPTAALDHVEVERLQQMMHRLKGEGIGFIFISHRLKEILQLADRVTVLRDGKAALEKQVDQTSIDEMISAMTGQAEALIERRAREKTVWEPHFSIEGLRVDKQAAPVSLTVGAGEIVAVFGLLGSGKTELAEKLFGANGSYQPAIGGQKRSIGSPSQAVKSGIAFIPEERGKHGVWKPYDIRSHLSLPFKGLISRKKENAFSSELIDLFTIQPQDPSYLVGSLSGGNQQKVAIAKWFGNKPTVMIFDEPMKGIDVSAKETIFQRIEAFASEGTSVLYFTAEPDEAIRIADRILVLSQGEIVQEVSPAEASLEQLLILAERRRDYAVRN